MVDARRSRSPPAGPPALRRPPRPAASGRDQPDRGVADADHPVAQHRAQRLGDQAGRVGEIDQPGIRCHVGDHPGGAERDRQGSQRIGDAAGADCLLAEDTGVQCPAFVPHPTGRSADPDRGEHHVGAGDGVVSEFSSLHPGPVATGRGRAPPRSPAACRVHRRATRPRRCPAPAGGAVPGRSAAPGNRRRPGSSAAPVPPYRLDFRRRRAKGNVSPRAISADVGRRRWHAAGHGTGHGTRFRCRHAGHGVPGHRADRAGRAAVGRHRDPGRGHGLLPGRDRQPRDRGQPAGAAHLAGRVLRRRPVRRLPGPHAARRRASTCRCPGGSASGTRRSPSRWPCSGTAR